MIQAVTVEKKLRQWDRYHLTKCLHLALTNGDERNFESNRFDEEGVDKEVGYKKKIIIEYLKPLFFK